MTTHPDPVPAPGRYWFTAALEGALRSDHLEISGCRRLSVGLYRLTLVGATPASVVAKRLDPSDAHRCRLLAHDWLPAVGLADACPPLLAVIGGPEQTWTVHTWLDGDPLHPYSDRVGEWVDLVATIHTRFAGHPIITEVRHHCRHLGADNLVGLLRDALRALMAVQRHPEQQVSDLVPVVSGLVERVRAAEQQTDHMRTLLHRIGGPDTLLHADLWPQNAVATADGLRLVDWDRMAIGPAIYDLSTLLLQLPPDRRQAAVDHYLNRVVAAGWPHLTTDEIVQLSTMVERARLSTLISWRVLDLQRLPGEAAWAGEQLRAIGQWWDGIDPGRDRPWASNAEGCT
jgi:hypothetical protein